MQHRAFGTRSRSGHSLGLCVGMSTGFAIVSCTDAFSSRCFAQDSRQSPLLSEPIENRSTRLTAAVQAAFAQRDFALAEKILREQQIPLDDQNFVPWYNLACALAHLDKVEDSLNALEASIQRGFSDLRQLQNDPDLAVVRATPRFKTIEQRWSLTLTQQAEHRINKLKLKYMSASAPDKYRFELDEHNRLAYLSAFDPTLFAASKAELTKLAAWWDAHVLPQDDALARQTPEARALMPLVTVLLPAREDYRQWAVQRFGDNWDRVGGVYVHDERALVAMDLGATLRHEFWHVLHWRDMEARRQPHPIWIMEGLCSLPEDLDQDASGNLSPIANWRTNMVRRLAQTGTLTSFETMFAMDQKKFVGTRPLAFYAQGRALFLWLYQQGKLRAWYSHYVQHFDSDRSGKLAFEHVFNKPLREVEKDFRRWAVALPVVQEVVGRGRCEHPRRLRPRQG